ncbi:hypothetical protein [Legionella pneumophila]|uniref:YdcA family protein n=1 Tax=Legionella pneumophila TaxID=446 RepID=UPI001A291662|nr:hypothetical protein [Legionella pneumophila]HAT9397959.1 hypothetical protein [Legionella pneumophila subsp. pneumophila]MCW8401141.1 hypothetical protein [Legionella pneumophila]MCZ4698199.1 hypothetical protein [Legionella pneumophila]MCZ4713604.1 hypothetical protein [Legionella pneumophila]MCZ4744103.1 hypothetical protein [Legionella pneumophila]
MNYLLLIILGFVTALGFAANTPCSGKKGGISHCLGEYFVCKDGLISQSKYKCIDLDKKNGQ